MELIFIKTLEYRIYDSVYNDIISGKKTIEFRILNDKTESIRVGDQIKFVVVDENDKYVFVKVKDKFVYNDIDDLWAHEDISNSVLNYSKDEFTDVFYNIFGKEKVENSKIVGILFTLM